MLPRAGWSRHNRLTRSTALIVFVFLGKLFRVNLMRENPPHSNQFQFYGGKMHYANGKRLAWHGAARGYGALSYLELYLAPELSVEQIAPKISTGTRAGQALARARKPISANPDAIKLFVGHACAYDDGEVQYQGFVDPHAAYFRPPPRIDPRNRSQEFSKKPFDRFVSRRRNSQLAEGTAGPVAHRQFHLSRFVGD